MDSFPNAGCRPNAGEVHDHRSTIFRECNVVAGATILDNGRAGSLGTCFLLRLGAGFAAFPCRSAGSGRRGRRKLPSTSQVSTHCGKERDTCSPWLLCNSVRRRGAFFFVFCALHAFPSPRRGSLTTYPGGERNANRLSQRSALR